MYILLSLRRTRLYEDPIEVLAPYTSTPHGSLDVLDECITVLGEVISGICHQLPGNPDSYASKRTFVERIIGITIISISIAIMG